MSTQIQTEAAGESRMVFRRTHLHRGRHIAVTPENSTMQHLAYGRIRLDSEAPRVEYQF